ncbi:MAG: molybdenum cofactor guanylyltransferase [Betaproteobacteria bacterium]|nr:molybdenum cofactor guanylyltransferase [Betaproteobacteria bacterium]
MQALPDPQVFGVILAGGLGRRMGGVDKGLQLLEGQALVVRAAMRLAPQVGALAINANRNLERYAALGYPVLPDLLPDFPGPLAGLHAALRASDRPLVAAIPCDSPFFPLDLVARLKSALEEAGAELAVARTAERSHPVFCLCRRELAGKLEEFLLAGGRRVGEWQGSQRRVEVLFDENAAFRNLNTLDDLA